MIPRDPVQFLSLPLHLRWEVTRRNPYYYAWWKLARAYRRQELTTEIDDLYGQVAAAIMLQLGVTGEPPDPATSFESLGGDELNSAWRSGSVHPMTLGSLAATLIADLPGPTLEDLAKLFLSVSIARKSVISVVRALQALEDAGLDGLQNLPPRPIVAIDPFASEQKIVVALKELLDRCRQAAHIPNTRDRSNRFEEYLAVFDQREGWQNGKYNPESEQGFEEIARTTKKSLGTLGHQYGRAFELIVGRVYSRELWYQAFGPIKFCSPQTPRTRRPLSSPNPIEVPFSRLADGDGEAIDVIGRGIPPTDQTMMEIVLDIESLIQRGKSDDQIAAELEVDRALVECVRSHQDMPS